jgi:hypothetical protein
MASPKLVSAVIYDDDPTYKTNNRCRKIFLPILSQESGHDDRVGPHSMSSFIQVRHLLYTALCSKKKTASEVQKCLQTLYLSTFMTNVVSSSREIPQNFLKLTDIPADLRCSVFLNPDLNIEDIDCFWNALENHVRKVHSGEPRNILVGRYIQLIQKLQSLCLTPKQILKRLYLL